LRRPNLGAQASGAGPSTLATLFLLQTAVASSTTTLLLVVTITWLISGAILLFRANPREARSHGKR
jgi:hypothetical protein